MLNLLAILKSLLRPWSISDVSDRVLRYTNRLGNGKAISVSVSDGDILFLRIERKIGLEDFVDGRFLPISSEGVKRRGGKRNVDMNLSYESAEALHRVLGSALQEARRRRTRRVFVRTMTGKIFAQLEYMRKLHPEVVR